MPDASFLQTDFRGGEWSPNAQGRADEPKYKTALNVSLNSMPLPEGAHARRPAFAFRSTTHRGRAGRLLPFDFSDRAAYQIEMTDGLIRLRAGSGFVYSNDIQTVIGISTATPAVLEVGAAVTWATGDTVDFLFDSVSGAADGALVRNRQFLMTRLTSTTFSLADPITGISLDGAELAWPAADVTVRAARVLTLVSPYTDGKWANVRRIQAHLDNVYDEGIALLLHGSIKPQLLAAPVEIPEKEPNVSTFTLAAQDFRDGPYLDPVIGATATPSALTGEVTIDVIAPAYDATKGYVKGDYVVASGIVYTSIVDPNLNHTPASSPAYWQVSNNGIAVAPTGFVETDVGRLLRLFSEPPLWGVGTTYDADYKVKYNGAYWQSFAGSNTGNQPGKDATKWFPITGEEAAIWTWARITSVDQVSKVKAVILGAPLLYSTPITTWRVGLYSETTGWPTCGTYYKGRLWLAGVDNNRTDSSNSNDPFNMAPTAPDGTVGDSNALSLIIDSDDTNEVFWIDYNAQGLVVGTRKGEWTLKPGATGGTITPTNFQFDRATKVGCANVLPIVAPQAIVMVSRYQRQMFEIFPDVFSGRITAPELTTYAKHMTDPLIAEIQYQSDPMPIVWARLYDGKLIGATYTRRSSFASEAPTFIGFHRHELGFGRLIESISVTPSPDLTLDALSAVTNDPATGIRYIEQATPIMEVTTPLTKGRFVDCAVTPSGAVAGATGLTLYGLWPLNGKTVAAQIGGLDCGDVAVANGSVFVPFSGSFTLAYLQTLDGDDYGEMACPVDDPAITVPAVLGATYTSQGQLLRPLAAADVGTRNGPAFGKTRREHMFAALITSAVAGAIWFGTTFDRLRPALFTTRGGTTIPPTEKYAGLHQGTLEDDYTFDSMLCWEVTRPVPGTIAAIGAFGHGQDR